MNSVEQLACRFRSTFITGERGSAQASVWLGRSLALPMIALALPMIALALPMIALALPMLAVALPMLAVAIRLSLEPLTKCKSHRK